MNFPIEILLVLIIAIFAQSTGTELANNTNFLLLLLLALYGFNSGGNCCSQNFFNQRSYI